MRNHGISASTTWVFYSKASATDLNELSEKTDNDSTDPDKYSPNNYLISLLL